jgi:hypothetical protein
MAMPISIVANVRITHARGGARGLGEAFLPYVATVIGLIFSLVLMSLSSAIVMLPEAGKSDVRSRSRVCASLPVILTR